jgi:NAD(P)-dependent dehydrogenase (short-subunit alcohol dehydrogenase family)
MLVLLRIVLILAMIHILTGVNSTPKRVLVLGGSGRVGGSAVRALSQLNGFQVDIGGRSIQNWQNYVKRAGMMSDTQRNRFKQIDITDSAALESLVGFYDIVVHTAGPFQQVRCPSVLEACLNKGVDYVDVCDDVELSRICRAAKYQTKAQESGSAAIISSKIFHTPQSFAHTSSSLSVHFHHSHYSLIEKRVYGQVRTSDTVRRSELRTDH